jgi:hypothetical protein
MCCVLVLQVLHCAVPPGHKSELVVDPGPGVLLVVGGSGKAMVRAAAVTDELTLDEADLHPGEGLELLSNVASSMPYQACQRPAGVLLTHPMLLLQQQHCIQCNLLLAVVFTRSSSWQQLVSHGCSATARHSQALNLPVECACVYGEGALTGRWLHCCCCTGTALFLSAGTSLSISCTEVSSKGLDAW